MICRPSTKGGKPADKTRKAALKPFALADGREITIVVVYTANAKKNFDNARKDINRAITNGVAQINTALNFSGIDLDVRLVYSGQTDYEVVGSFNDDLTRIRDTDAGRSIRALQDANSADVVALIREDGDMDGTSFMLQNDGLDYSDSGIEIVHWTCVDEGCKCLAHEFGHLLGCAHDRSNVDVYGWSTAYSYGYCFAANDGYSHGDLMAYACADRRETLYSDPRSLFKINPADPGVPTGVPELDASGNPNPDAADNARTIRETKAIVANYRMKPAVNVERFSASTR